MRDFLEETEAVAKTLVAEVKVPDQEKTIKTASLGGIAGAETRFLM